MTFDQIIRPHLVVALVAASAIGSSSAIANDPDTFNARRIDASRGDAVMYLHEQVGPSCKSGQVGKLTGLSEVRLGDTVKQGNHSIQVGIIEVTKHNSDMTMGDKTLAKKGDIECVLAANSTMLPYDDKKCRALWVRITNCQPVD
ncbi:MAG TPA: hypothetical protein VL180_09000 [Burkholderiales bacterium]|jgi:hypothetical protein|nr:hypothetical protein [Burkholderiales bacterium]